MLSNAYAAPLRLEPVASPLLRLFVIMAYLLAAASTLLITAEPFLRLSMLLPLTVSLFWLWRSRQELNGRPLSLVWDGKGQWTWQQGGESAPLVLRGDSYLSEAVVILNFGQSAGVLPRSLVLLPDSLPQEVHRRLRVRLRLERKALNVKGEA